MRVKYRVHFSNNSAASYSSVCFRNLCTKVRNNTISYLFSSRNFLTDVYQQTYKRLLHKQPKGKRLAGITSISYKEPRYFRELLCDLPFLADIYTFDSGRVFVDTVNQPADKVITALRLLRQTAANSCAITRHKKAGYAYDRKLYAAMALFHIGVDEMGKSYIQPSFNSEYDLFDFSTFGKQSLEQFVNADASFYPWQQADFIEQGGYLREQQGVLFEMFDDSIEMRAELHKEGEYVTRPYTASPWKDLNRILSLPTEQAPLIGGRSILFNREAYKGFTWLVNGETGRLKFKNRRQAFGYLYDALYGGNQDVHDSTQAG